MHIQTYLYDRPTVAREFADWLYRNPSEIPSSSVAEVPVEDMALWGISDNDWRAAITAVKIQRIADNVSKRCPIFSLSKEKTEWDSQRLQLNGQVEIRPMLLEDFLGHAIDSADEQAICEIIRLIPKSWHIVIEDRGSR